MTESVEAMIAFAELLPSHQTRPVEFAREILHGELAEFQHDALHAIRKAAP